MKNVWIGFLSFSMLMLNGRASAQTTDWQQTSHWKIYKIHHSGSLRLPVDSLQSFKHIGLNEDTMHYYLQKMIAWPRGKTAVWMGAFIASYERDQHPAKLDISVYGGFIFDEYSKQYFELPEPYRAGWLEFLNRTVDRIETNDQ